MKTAMDNVIGKIRDLKEVDLELFKLLTPILSRGLDEEKQQIIEAVTYGNRMEFYDASEMSGEQYYNEHFN